MPVALSTKFTFPVSLPMDTETPEATRPTFDVRFISELIERKLKDAIKGEEGELWETYRERLKGVMLPLIASVRNFPEGISTPEDALLNLHIEEVRDLAFEILRQNTLGYAELKKSKLQQVSGAA